MTSSKQRELDSRRKVYVLTLPSDLTVERVVAFLLSISGTLRPSFLGFFTTPSIVFETWTTDQGITHRLLVPSSDATFIVSHLESMIPGTYVALDDSRPEIEWSEVTEVGMTRPARTLNIPSGSDMSHSILTSLQAMEGDQTVLVQWVIAPCKPEQPPTKQSLSYEAGLTRKLVGRLNASDDEIRDRTEKLKHPNFSAVGRVAVLAQPEHVRALTGNIMKSLAATATGANRLAGYTRTNRKTIEAVNLASTPWQFPAQVNTTELASLISWPTGRPYIAGLARSRTRIMHVPQSVPVSGVGATVIGASNAQGKERKIAIEAVDMLKHVHIMGPTESGKTSLAAYMAEQTMKNGSGLVLIETKGDLFRAIMERVPPKRIDDVIVWDVDDTDYYLGFNFLRQSSSRSAIDELNALMGRLFPESGVLTTGPLYHGLHALAEHPKGTLIDLMALLDPRNEEEKRWRLDLIASLKKREIRRYWEDYIKQDAATQSRNAEPLKRRMWQFIGRAEIKNSLGQSESTFYMDDVVRDGKILLINLNSVRIGDGAGILGSLLLSSLWNSVRSVQHEREVILYMDEFQNFINLSATTSPSDMLAMSRSFGLGLVLAHQHLGQITDRELSDALLANARSKIVFQTTDRDARTMASEFGSLVRPDDLMNLQRREAIARVATSSGVSEPFTMRTLDLGPGTSRPSEIRRLSRQKYGRAADDVDREIEVRRTGADQRPRKKPPTGQQSVKKWG